MWGRAFSIFVGAAIAAIAMGACGEVRSEQCKSICQQWTDCAEAKSNSGTYYPYDIEECIVGCVRLERDNIGKLTVEKQVKCAENAGGDCDKLMRCL